MPRLFGHYRLWDCSAPPLGYRDMLSALGTVLYATDGPTVVGEWVFGGGGELVYQGPSGGTPTPGVNCYRLYGRTFLSSALADTGADSQFYYATYLSGNKPRTYWAFPCDPANVRTMVNGDIIITCTYGILQKYYNTDPVFRGLEVSHGIYNDATGNGAIGAAPTGINGVNPNNLFNVFVRGCNFINGANQHRWYSASTGVTVGTYAPTSEPGTDATTIYNTLMGTAYTIYTLPLGTQMLCAVFTIRNTNVGTSRRLVVASPVGSGLTGSLATNIVYASGGTLATNQYPRLVVNTMQGISGGSGAAPSARTGCTFCILGFANPTDAQLIAIAQQMFNGVPL